MATLASIFFFLLGLALGSFGNVLVYRLPLGWSIGGFSRCPNCRRELRAWEIIPILSFLWLRGKCATCRARISWQYPFVELASALLFVFAVLHEPSLEAAVFFGLSLWLLLLCVVSDARSGGVPDALSFPFVAVSSFYALITAQFSVAAVLLGGGFFALQWFVSNGRWVGSADIILGTGVGVLLGSWQMTLLAILFAYVIGAFYAVTLLTARRKRIRDTLAFVPFLGVGTIMALLIGDDIIAMLLRGY
jgi:prepilin signal peptidase PulO-like enzyme (type II secretory pathway)